MRLRKTQQASWWWLGELREVPRCLLWRGLRHHCPMYNVSCIFFNKCLYFSYCMSRYFLDRPRMSGMSFSLLSLLKDLIWGKPFWLGSCAGRKRMLNCYKHTFWLGYFGRFPNCTDQCLVPGKVLSPRANRAEPGGTHKVLVSGVPPEERSASLAPLTITVQQVECTFLSQCIFRPNAPYPLVPEEVLMKYLLMLTSSFFQVCFLYLIKLWSLRRIAIVMNIFKHYASTCFKK